MTTRRVLAFALGVLLTGGLGSAQAVPLTWDLNNVVFGDGTTVTGSFVFDADTTTFSDLDLTSSGGTAVPAQNTWVYNTLCVGCQMNGGFAGFVAVDSVGPDLTGAAVLSLFGSIGAPMTNAGGVIGLNFGVAGTCALADCAQYRR